MKITEQKKVALVKTLLGIARGGFIFSIGVGTLGVFVATLVKNQGRRSPRIPMGGKGVLR